METFEKEPMLAAVWLLATLSGDHGIGNTINYRNGLRNKKAVTNIDITETCRCIIDVSDKIPLRRTSNLMFGTVLAYKKKCLLNWRDVNSCRMLLQRLHTMTGVNLHNGNGSNGKGKGKNTGSRENKNGDKEGGKCVKLLHDDPFFDISQGLIVDWIDACHNSSSNPNSGSHTSKDALNDWKVKEFQSMNVDDDDADEDIIEDNRVQGDSQILIPKHTQSENWDELDFEFDANGEIVNPRDDHDAFKEANVTTALMDERDIHRSLSDGLSAEGLEVAGFDNAHDMDFGFDQFEPIAQGSEEAHPGQMDTNQAVEEPAIDANSSPNPSHKQKPDSKSRKRKRRCLVIDEVVMLTSANIKKIRDGYIDKEHDILESRYMHRVEMSIIDLRVHEMTDISKYYQNFSNPFRGEPHDAGEQAPVEFGDPFGDGDHNGNMDIEYGRRRARSRSSSVSSVELGRRASVTGGRHSSSFHFDFDNQIPDVGLFGAASYVPGGDGDIAQLDISFIGGQRGGGGDGLGRLCDIESDNESNRTVLESLEEFMECIPVSGEISFSAITEKSSRGSGSGSGNGNGNPRAETATRFMYVLQLATNGRVSVKQEHALFGEIWIKRV
jgi:hypothetical protein